MSSYNRNYVNYVSMDPQNLCKSNGTRYRHFLQILMIAALAFASHHTSNGDELFRDKVAPILARRCFTCHNQSENKGDFSLQTATALADSGFIEPGEPDSSYLLEVITADNGKPPAMPKDSDPLSASEVSTIRRWIAGGADWPDGFELKAARVTDRRWWSLQPLKRSAVPDVVDSEWAQTPVDAFVLAKLRQQQLSPSPRADRRTLIRRLYFDLIGLPPTPKEIESFIADTDAKAYEKLVDRLLESPHYGERWARHWLDVVHYGDTHGYDKDKLRRNAWPYRDYVIRSFNGDKPYHRFVREQIAGDVLWPHTTDGITATGFIAAGPWDFIGHAEVPESKIDGQVARNLDRDDMVTTTMNTFCSLTIQCARCHHHKLDPVTMDEYYNLQAVFAAIDRADRTFDADPSIAQRRADLRTRQAQLQQQLDKIDTEIETAKPPELRHLDQLIAAAKAELAPTPDANQARSPSYGYHSQVAHDQDTVKWVQVDLGDEVEICRVLLWASDEYGWTDFGFPLRFRIEAADEATFKAPKIIADHTGIDYPRPGHLPAVFAADGVRGRYIRVTATKLWNRRRNGSAPTDDWIFAISELAVLSKDRHVKAQAVTALDTIDALPRWGRVNLTDGVYGKWKLGIPLTTYLPQKNPTKPTLTQLLAKRKKLLNDAIPLALLSRRDKLQTDMANITAELRSLPAQQKVYAGTVHNGTGSFRGRYGLGPRDIHVLIRGDVTKPGKLATPGTVSLIDGVDPLFSLPANHDEGARRMALADWIIRRDNPLTWRSIVNRVWLYHFGRGICDSPNDFGRGGALPSHPELLDWLAVEFRDNGQSIKQLHKIICNSAVYQQASRADDDNVQAAREIDGDNRLLWRMNRRRLSAEEIRDAVLAVAGQLDPVMGGPGFHDFIIEQPQHSPHYEYDKYDPNDTTTHRRAVYRFIVRSQPQPFMNALDCADPSMSVPQRDETLTALQALAMLNNRFIVAMAKQFEKRLTSESDSRTTQIARGFYLTTGRHPQDDELSVLVEYSNSHGLANTCRVLLNLNEFVFVD